MAVLSVSHPDQNIANLSTQKLSRFVEINRFNDGNIYHINLDEEFFYKEHPYYIKTLLIKDKLSSYYPNLVLYDQTFDQDIDKQLKVVGGLYINTIGVRFYLMSNSFADPVLIGQLLYNMKLNMNLINQLEFVDDQLDSASLTDFTLPIQTHQGAHEFFTKSGLYTTVKERTCLLIDGKCDYGQLQDHHLYYDFGKTFDEMHNSDSTNNPYKSQNKVKLVIA